MENYFSPEAVTRITQNFKQEEKKNQFSVHINQLQGASGSSRSSEESFSLYGNQASFYCKEFGNLENDQTTLDQRLDFGFDYLVNDLLTLRLNTSSQMRNKQAISLVNPRMRYQWRPTTQIEGGFTVGSFNTYQFGLSEIINEKISIGLMTDFNHTLNKLTHSSSLKYRQSQDLSKGATFVYDWQKHNYSFRLKEERYFDRWHMQEYKWSLLSLLNKMTSQAQVTSDAADASVKFNHKISKRFTHSINLSAGSLLGYKRISIENEIKWRLSNHVKLFLGLSYSTHGIRLLYGLKVAGIKVKFESLTPELELVQDKDALFQMGSLKSVGTFLGIFLASFYALRKLDAKLNKKKLAKWNEGIYRILIQKQEDSILLIKRKAKDNQTQAQEKLIIMRAFYGDKRHIKKYLEAYLSQNRIEDVSLPFDAETVNEMPPLICDVTIPLRFILDPNTGLNLEKMSSKQSLFGFFNPIPPFDLEHSNPVLCIIFKKPYEQGERIFVNYYRDNQEVKVLIE